MKNKDMDSKIKVVPGWFKVVLVVSAIFNFLGAITFSPLFPDLFALTYLPLAHPMYMWILCFWIFAFGVGYLLVAITGRPERIFIAVGAFGKFTFFGLLTFFSLTGALPPMSVTAGIGDLIFSLIFAYWLFRS